MSNPTTLLRSIIISSICLPLALILGYTLAGPFNYSSVVVFGSCVLALLMPVLLRLHHPLLLLSWNATMIVFFLPGDPGVWMPMVAFSLLLSVIQRTIDRDFRFISVPSVAWPLMALAAVILVTAEGTGGIKFRSMGGDVFGGRHYMVALVAIAGYFAITAQRIPLKRAKLFTALFLLGGVTTMIGDVFYFQSKLFQWVYWFFPPNTDTTVEGHGFMTRLYGVNASCLVVAYFMLARFGVSGLFSFQKPWRSFLFFLLSGFSLLGGYRSFLIALVLCFAVQFCLEGLHRTRLLFVVIIGLMFTGTLALPFAKHFPPSIQRALSFLPIPIDPLVKADAEASSLWRIELWQSLVPELKEHLFFGKGYAFTPMDFDYAINNRLGFMKSVSEEDSWAALSGDYHSGPLSVLIPFAIWGALALTWFLAAGTRVLYRNWRYGDPELRLINIFLFTIFTVHIFFYIFIFGAFDGDMHYFVGYLALGIALNGGMAARPAPEPVRRNIPEIPVRARMEPAFQRFRSRE